MRFVIKGLYYTIHVYEPLLDKNEIACVASQDSDHSGHKPCQINLPSVFTQSSLNTQCVVFFMQTAKPSSLAHS